MLSQRAEDKIDLEILTKAKQKRIS